MKSWPRPQPAIATATAAAIVNARTAVMPALGSGTRRLRRRGGGRAGAQALRLGGVAAARIPAQVPIDGGGGAPVAQPPHATPPVKRRLLRVPAGPIASRTPI